MKPNVSSILLTISLLWGASVFAQGITVTPTPCGNGASSIGGMCVAPIVPPAPPPTPPLFDFTADFSAISPGTPFETWNNVQQNVFNDPSIVAQYNNDFQSNPHYMWFVAGSACGRNKHMLESWLPAGDLGDVVNGYQNKIILRMQDTDAFNISFDMCLDNSYYLGSLAKFAPHLGFGDDTQTSASSNAFIYECRPQPPPANPGCASGAPASSGPPRLNYYYNIKGGDGDFSSPDLNVITVGVWHNFKMQLIRGPNGSVSFWEDGVLQYTHAVSNICNGPNEPVNPGCTTGSAVPFVAFMTWFGGGSSVYSPPVNAISYFDNIRIWSGIGN